MSDNAQVRLTDAGLRMLMAADQDPYQRNEVDPEQFDRLVGAGLLDERGRALPKAQPALEAMREPVARLAIEAAVGRTGRRWSAAIGEAQAVVLAPPAVALGPDVSAAEVAAFDEPPPEEFELRIMPPGWAVVDACAWAGIGPRLQRADPFTLPTDVLRCRLEDAGVPVPDGIDPELWAEPMLMWDLTIDPGESTEQPGRHGLLVLDTGATGLWAFTATQPESRLVPLPSYEVWRLILRALRQAPPGGPEESHLRVG
ncbi:hypothetical protein GCM10022224_057020 [Nonomuraea antimicrobica]|uniref:EspG family protein n=1 Tax=Nonomuraea antimicrobica TaxID=561173 RepID=A0ABP7CD19_9ACTN